MTPIYYRDPNIEYNLKTLNKIIRDLSDHEPDFGNGDDYPIISIEMEDRDEPGKLKLFKNHPGYYEILPHGWNKIDSTLTKVHVRLLTFKFDLLTELQLLHNEYLTAKIIRSYPWSEKEYLKVLFYISRAMQLVRDRLR